MAQRDLYDVLGADKKATPDELKAAFRRAAKACHPDHNPHDKDATKKFQEVNAAYQTLSNPTERAWYDRTEASRRDADREQERNEQARAEREAQAERKAAAERTAREQTDKQREAETTRKAEEERAAKVAQEAQRKAEAERKAAEERKAKAEAEVRQQAETKRKAEAEQKAAADRRAQEHAEAKRRAEAQRIFQQEQERSEQVFQEVFTKFTEDPDTFYHIQESQTYGSFQSVLTKVGADFLAYKYADALNHCFKESDLKRAQQYLNKAKLFKPAQISEALDLYQKRTYALIVRETPKIAEARQNVVEQAASLSARLVRIAETAEAGKQLDDKLSSLDRYHDPLSFLDTIHRYLTEEDATYAAAEKVGSRILEHRERLQKLEQIKPAVTAYENIWQDFEKHILTGSGQYHIGNLTWVREIRDTLFPWSSLQPALSDQEKLEKITDIFQKNSSSKKTVSGIFGGNKEREASSAEAGAMLPKLVEQAAIISPYESFPSISQLEKEVGFLTRSLEADTASLQRTLTQLRKADASSLFKYRTYRMECLRGFLDLPETQNHGFISKDLRTVLQAILHSQKSGMPLLKCVDETTLRYVCTPEQIATATENFRTSSRKFSQELWRSLRSQDAIPNDIRALQGLVETLDRPLAPENRAQINGWENSIERLQSKIEDISAKHGIDISGAKNNAASHKTERPGAKYAAQPGRTASVS